MKIGDKVYVKGTNEIVNICGFHENLVWISFYSDGECFNNSYQIKKVKNKLAYSSPYFSDTFITEKELRKIKLRKINNL